MLHFSPLFPLYRRTHGYNLSKIHPKQKKVHIYDFRPKKKFHNIRENRPLRTLSGSRDGRGWAGGPVGRWAFTQHENPYSVYTASWDLKNRGACTRHTHDVPTKIPGHGGAYFSRKTGGNFKIWQKLAWDRMCWL